MIMSGLSDSLRTNDIPEDARWIEFTYNAERRFGLDLEEDGRPGTNNRVVLTDRGIRTFKVNGMEDIVEVGRYWDDV